MFALGLFISVTVFSQTGTVTIVLKRNQNRQVLIDGKNYTPYGTTGVPNPSVSGIPNSTTITVTDLEPGQHELQVTRRNYYRKSDVKTLFTLRRNFDKTIVVAANGTLQQTESRKSYGAGTKPAMSSLALG